MQENIQNERYNLPDAGGDAGRNIVVNRRRGNRRTPDNVTFDYRVTDQYCWTYGECNHPLNACTRKAQGLMDAATRANRMQVLNTFCQPVE